MKIRKLKLNTEAACPQTREDNKNTPVITKPGKTMRVREPAHSELRNLIIVMLHTL